MHMKFSERILSVKPSPTLAVTALANSLKAQGIDVIGFGSGEPDFDTPRFIKDAAIRAIESGKTKYTPAGGIPELKEAIAMKFKRDNNLEYSNSEVTVNCGGKHSFYNLMQVLLNGGDEVIIPAPYWVSYPPMVLLAGGNPVIIDTTDEKGFKITPDQLNSAITERTRAVLINSPSNPTGATYTRAELEALAEILEKKDLLIISDDIYEFILYENRSFYNLAMLSDSLKRKTLVLNGVSKTYSMTGWRIGYIAGDEEIIKKVEILQSQSTSNPSSISQWASVAALTGDQRIVDDMIDAFVRRRKLIVDGLNAIPGIQCINPEGSFYAFPNVQDLYRSKSWESVEKKYGAENRSGTLAAYLLEEANVAVVPGIGFGSDNYIRLSFATSDENITEGIKRIAGAVEKLL